MVDKASKTSADNSPSTKLSTEEQVLLRSVFVKNVDFKATAEEVK